MGGSRPARDGLDDRNVLPAACRLLGRGHACPPATDHEHVHVQLSSDPRAPLAGATVPQPTPTAEPADHVEVPLAERPRSQESMVIEGRRHPARADVQPREQVAPHGRPGVLAARHQSVTDGDLARPHARPAIDLAFAPAALAGAAHQPARSVEAEAARQDRSVGGQQRDRERLPVESLERLAVERDADPAPWGVRRRVRTERQATRRHVSGCGRSGCCRCRRAWIRGTRRGPPCRARDRCRCP